MHRICGFLSFSFLDDRIPVASAGIGHSRAQVVISDPAEKCSNRFNLFSYYLAWWHRQVLHLMEDVLMQTRTICGSLTVLLLLMALMLTPPAMAAVSFGGGIGGTTCNDVKRSITREWFEMKNFFRPGEKSMKRPRSRDYYCVSPGYVRDAIEARSMAIGLKCYTVQGQKFCCDSSLRECAAIQ